MEIEKVEDFDYIIISNTSIDDLTKEEITKLYNCDNDDDVFFEILYVENKFETKKLSDIDIGLSKEELEKTRCSILFKSKECKFSFHQSMDILKFIAKCVECKLYFHY